MIPIDELAQFVGLLASVEHEVVACFREGGGVPHAAYPEFDLLMAEDSKDMAEALLIDEVVPLVNGLAERLEAGISVADIGCGSGHHLNLLAGRYPASRFVGYDFSANAIAEARSNADSRGLKNVRLKCGMFRIFPTPARSTSATTLVSAISSAASGAARRRIASVWRCGLPTSCSRRSSRS